jgi:hypothetical protein
MNAKYIMAGLLFGEFLALAVVMLRLSAFRVEEGSRRASPRWLIGGILPFLPEEYTNRGKRLLPIAWALSVLVLLTLGLGLWLFTQS